MNDKSLSVWQNSRATVQQVISAKALRSKSRLLQLLDSTAVEPDDFEQTILQAYVQLAVMPERTDGARTTTLAWSSGVEIRLTEMPKLESNPSYAPPFWLEVYSHDLGVTIDSCGCFEFNEAELADAADIIREYMDGAN